MSRSSTHFFSASGAELDLFGARSQGRAGPPLQWLAPDSVKLCGTFEIRLAPWVDWTMKALGNPWMWMPCIVRMPSAQYSDNRNPSRPTTSKPARLV